MNEKPNRNNNPSIPVVEPYQEDHFDDRRLSDLLPTEFIRQIGFDPQAFLFSSASLQMRRRMTDPGTSLIYTSEPPAQRRMTSTETYQPTPPPTNYGISPLYEVPQQRITNWYLVELSDCTTNAFSLFNCGDARSDGVVVRDHVYLRFGRIVKEIKNPGTFDRSTPQIISVDQNSYLYDYIFGISNLATAMIPTFLKNSNAQCEFVSMETVSYDARALFRVKLTNTSDPNIDKFIRSLVQAFCVAVEVYE
ncbi:hypothetical protein M9Y10_038348 [Tritrichomonas musculus]|uniref:Uncharacterized protein n=1 Tax=Tritrichomonas musculus TaxID=1915356 RepID=A0ABR2K856_9EUKA